MVQLINEIRLFTCELLLDIIIKIAPKNNQGYRLLKNIKDYCDYEIKLKNWYPNKKIKELY